MLIGFFVLTGFTLFALFPTSGQAAERISGKDRYQTAIKVSQKGWPSSNSVILATGEDFPDALAVSPLAYELDAPILLTNSTSLTSVTETEIKRLKATNIIILGGEKAVSKKVEDRLKEIGIKTIKRFGGKDRYETSVLIAKEYLNKTTNSHAYFPYVIASGQNFADALSATGLATRFGAPILLSEKNKLPASISAFLNSSRDGKGFVAGGTAAIANSTFETINKLGNAYRLVGEDRYDTAYRINQYMYEEDFYTDGNPSPKNLAVVVRGDAWPDALTSSVLAAKQNAWLLTVKPNSIPYGTTNTIKKFNLSNFQVIGGKAAIQDQVLHSIGVKGNWTLITKDNLASMIKEFRNSNRVRFDGITLTVGGTVSSQQASLNKATVKKDGIWTYYDFPRGANVTSANGKIHSINFHKERFYLTLQEVDKVHDNLALEFEWYDAVFPHGIHEINSSQSIYYYFDYYLGWHRHLYNEARISTISFNKD